MEHFFQLSININTKLVHIFYSYYVKKVCRERMAKQPLCTIAIFGVALLHRIKTKSTNLKIEWQFLCVHAIWTQLVKLANPWRYIDIDQQMHPEHDRCYSGSSEIINELGVPWATLVNSSNHLQDLPHQGFNLVTNLTVLKSFRSFFNAALERLLKR